MKWRAFVTDYMTFSRKERIGLLVLTGLLVILFLLPVIINNQSRGRFIAADTGWMAAAKKLEITGSESNQRKSFSNQATNHDYAYQYDRSVDPTASLFYFDPNTLSAEGWKKLGLKDKTIRTIQNYVSKGGHFKKPEDLQKIFGLPIKEYERLVPFVKIEKKAEEERNSFTETKNQYESRRSVPIAIDINTADTSAFIALPGIGAKLALRIINFREKLGGFYSIAQIGETYGLPDSTFQKIKSYLKMENIAIKKININTATAEELKAHPYIKYNLANPIIAYRNEHGSFAKVEDLKKVMTITEEIYNKIGPYLTVQ